MDNFKLINQENRERKLAAKFEDKDFVERWRPIRQASGPTTILLQVLTGFLAVSFVAYGVKLLSGSWSLGFIIGASLVFVFEYFKRSIVDNTSANAVKKRSISLFGVAALLLFTSASTISSYFGTPIIVEEFAPMPAKVNEAAIFARYDSLREEAEAYWLSEKEAALALAAEVHKKNNWKGVTVRAARSTELKFKEAAKSATDSLNSRLAAIGAAEASTLNKAEEEFITATAKRQKEKSNLGNILGGVTLFLELCFLYLYFWVNYYDFREACKVGLITPQSKVQSKQQAPVNTDFKEQSKKESLGSGAGQRGSGIGFNQEGRIVKEGSKLKILCEVKDGLKAYDASYLSTLFREADKKGQPKAEYWKEKLEALRKAKEA